MMSILVSHSNRFFLAVLQHNQSTKMEHIIIALITIEAVIGLCGLGLTLSGYK